MGIGQRHQVQLVQIVSTQGSGGRWEEAEWQKFGVWAEVSNPSGFREYVSGQTRMGHTKRFLIRFKFNKYPNADWLIRYKGQDWTVSDMEEVDEKRFYWSMTATTKGDV